MSDPTNQPSIDPITREERDAAVELIERYAEFEQNNFGAHRITTASLTVVAALRASEAREKKLREALDYYADESEYIGGEEASIFDDRGNRARQALGE